MVSVGENGFVWDEELIVVFVIDLCGFLKELGGDNKIKMIFKLCKGGEDVVVYLVIFGVVVEIEEVDVEGIIEVIEGEMLIDVIIEGEVVSE